MAERRRLHNFAARFEEYRGLVLQSAILYCRCGYPILTRRMENDGFWVRRFYSYMDYERELFLCPQCGASLQGVELSPGIPEGV